MKGTPPLLSRAIVFVRTWRFAVAVWSRRFRRRSISEKATNICRHLHISAGIFRYIWASSDICRYLQTSAGILRYPRASSNICRCQPPVNKIFTSHMEYTESLPAPPGGSDYDTNPGQSHLGLTWPDCKHAGYLPPDLPACERRM